MNRNIWTLLIVSALFGLSVGIYDLALPFFLERLGYWGMAIVYAIPFPVIFVMRVYVGQLSDFFGRKIFYTASLGLGALSNFLTPLTWNALSQMVLKTARDSTLPVREAMHALILYEEDQNRFTKFIGRTRGSEFFFIGVGSLVSGYLMVRLGGQRAALLIAGGLLLAAVGLFAAGLQEPKSLRARPRQPGLRDLFSIALPPKLALLTAFGFAFNLSLSISHTFYLPLFFRDKFSPVASTAAVGVVMAIHRFTLGVPLLFAGRHLEKHPKGIYIGTVVAEGASICAAAALGNFYVAAAIWLLHDLLGAGIWLPIQQRYLQEFARPGSRGADVSRSLGLMQLGNMIGPFIAAALLASPVADATRYSLPYLVSGALVALSSLLLIGL